MKQAFDNINQDLLLDIVEGVLKEVNFYLGFFTDASIFRMNTLLKDLYRFTNLTEGYKRCLPKKLLVHVKKSTVCLNPLFFS